MSPDELQKQLIQIHVTMINDIINAIDQKLLKGSVSIKGIKYYQSSKLRMEIRKIKMSALKELKCLEKKL